VDLLYRASLDDRPLKSPYLAQAERISPRHGYTSYQIGLFAFQEGRFEEAYDRLSALAKTNYPKDALFYAGLSLVGLGRAREGEALMLESLIAPRFSPRTLDKPAPQFDPTGKELQDVLAVYDTQDKRGRLPFFLERMIILQPNNRNLYFYLIFAHQQIGDEVAAKKAVEHAMRQFPRDAIIFQLLVAD
jgi:tetratricopeptide (TPR) repeat protein